MASGMLVPKKALIDQVRRTMVDGESGVYTILTDHKRSVMLRFSVGKLVYSLCRSRNVADAIDAINECAELKFSYSTAQPKDQPEIMPAEAFFQAIAPGEILGGGAHDTVAESQVAIETTTGSQATDADVIDSALLGQYCEVARDYMGMAANIMIPNIFAKRLSTDATIDEIVAVIAIPEDAEAFRQRVAELKVSDVTEEEVKAEPDHRLFF